LIIHLLGHSLGHALCHLRKDVVKRTAAASTTTRLPETLTKCLCKYITEVSVTEGLLEDLVYVDVVEVGSGRVLTKRVIIASLARIAQTSVCFADLLKCLISAWCSVLVWVQLESELNEQSR
jgi:hypothetical protein